MRGSRGLRLRQWQFGISASERRPTDLRLAACLLAEISATLAKASTCKRNINCRGDDSFNNHATDHMNESGF